MTRPRHTHDSSPAGGAPDRWRARTAVPPTLRTFVVMAVVALPTSVLAVHPEAAQPVAGGRPTLIGREQNGRTFRKPGTLLYRARRTRRHVDPDVLRRRTIQQVTGRVRHTSAFARANAPAAVPAASPDGDLSEPAARPDDDGRQPGESPDAATGLRAWHVLLFLALTAAALVLVFRLTSRRR